MEILTAALKTIHKKCGLTIEVISHEDIALTDKNGTIVKIFHSDSSVFDIWDTADDYLLRTEAS